MEAVSRNLHSGSSSSSLPSSSQHHLKSARFHRHPLNSALSTSLAPSHMAMATATAAMATAAALHSPSHVLSARPSAVCPALSSRTSVAFSGYNAAVLKANNAVGRAVFSNSSRLSVKAVVEVDVAKIVPQADRVLIRLEALQAQSAGGVLLPSSAVKFDRYLQGEIIATGSEVTGVEKGQKVMFADINAYEVNLGTSDRLCFCRNGDLLAIVQ